MAYPYLQIGSDPTTWMLSEAIDAAALTSRHPLKAAVVAGMNGKLTLGRNGTLILSSRAAGSVVLSGVGNAVPSGGHLVSPPFLYLPSAAGLKPGTPGYALPPDTDVAALQDEITTAMSRSEFCTVPSGHGVLVLHGGTLPFVVLFPGIAGTPHNAIPSG
jgi:hypothetical protein